MMTCEYLAVPIRRVAADWLALAQEDGSRILLRHEVEALVASRRPDRARANDA
jgi:hypothetical protein